ncbi:MAG TPA: hypothetical protein VNK96_07580 [Fimbriimonadales bacterium]|nr:hypothetical protein [Fimbriimonadales bacterium]
MKTFPFLTLLLLGLFGCASDKDVNTSSSQDNNVLAKEAAPNEENIAVLEKSYESAKKEWNASPNDKEKQKKYVEATVAYANKVMYGPGLPKEKYPKALRLYEEALKIDPSHREAKANRDMILSIYRQMGRKPPEPKS